MINWPEIYGLLAEFETQDELVAAASSARAAGYRLLEAYSPYPVPELYHILHPRRTWVAPIVLAGGLFGCIGGYFMQYYLMAVDYPLNVGGRPLHSWPSFIPVTFELTILAAVFAAMIGMFALNRLPQLDHPLFNVDHFVLVTRNHFFLCISAQDPNFHLEKTRAFLRSLKPQEVTNVETQLPYSRL